MKTTIVKTYKYITISISDNIFPVGVADLSAFPDNLKLFYFNRLFVHPRYRNKGIAHKIMKEVVKIVDDNDIDILLEINPYGDLNMKQLISFYLKYLFKEHNEIQFLRKCKSTIYIIKWNRNKVFGVGSLLLF